jgi:RsiW-degrading membrane proteinase PrsW (M82 family)
MGSDQFFQQLLGHFVGAGLLEELFKSIPLWFIILLGPNLSNLNLPGFIKKKVNPTIAILIGTASAVAFIVIETLGQYVPDIDDPYDLAYGLMLLIPRFITGLAGHVSWSGIFAYFIALGFYYKKVNMIYPLIGWFLASILHGLWNSVFDFSILMGFAVSVGTFIIFMVFLLKAKKSFPI